MVFGKRVGASGKPAKKRKNMPGYFLGMAKDGDKSWMVANRPQDIKQVLKKQDFLNSEIEPGTIIGLDSDNNGIFIGLHKGRALVFNPKINNIKLQNFDDDSEVKVMKYSVGGDYFKNNKKWTDSNKIPGTDLLISDILSNPHQKHNDLDLNKNYSHDDYIRSSKSGDLISFSNNPDKKFKVLMTTKRFLVVENQNGIVHSIDFKQPHYFKPDVFLHDKDSYGEDVKKLQKSFKNKRYRLISNGKGAVATFRAKQKINTNDTELDPFSNEIQRNAANRFNGLARLPSEEAIDLLKDSGNKNKKITAYNKNNNKIEELTLGESNYRYYQSNGLVPRDKDGDQVDINDYVVIKKEDDNKVKKSKSYNLIRGDQVFFKNGGDLVKAIVGKVFNATKVNFEDALYDETGKNLIKTIESLKDDEFEIPENFAKSSSPRNILLTIPSTQTHVIVHSKDGANKPYKIKKVKNEFDSATRKQNTFLDLIDENGIEHQVSILNDKIQKNSIIDESSLISSIEHDPSKHESYNSFLSKYNGDPSSPVANLHRYGIEKFKTEMAIPGVHNHQILIFDKHYGDYVDSFNYKNELKINNEYAGVIKRDVETDDPNMLHNDLFKLPKELQGNGIAQRFYEAQERIAQKLGFDGIKMYCALDVGGYAWAKKGFEFESKIASDEMRERFLEHFEELSIDDWKKIDSNITIQDVEQHRDRFETAINNIFSARDFADFKYHFTGTDGQKKELLAKRRTYQENTNNKEYSFGKAAMLGSSWDGVKMFNLY